MALKEEIAEYQEQLKEIRSALREDSENEELKIVESELVDLIEQLSSLESPKEVAGATEPAEPEPEVKPIKSGEHQGELKPKKDTQWQVGSEVLIVSPNEPSQTGVIVSVTGSSTLPIYTVKFRSTGRVENVAKERLRAPPAKVVKHRNMTKADRKLESSKAAWKDFAKKNTDRRRKKQPATLGTPSKHRHF